MEELIARERQALIYSEKQLPQSAREIAIGFEATPSILMLGSRKFWKTHTNPSTSRLLTPRSRIRIVFWYPFRKPIRLRFDHPGGFTLHRVLVLISRTYQQLYNLETETSPIKPAPLAKNSANRNTTSGKVGICCHFLDQLFLEALWFDARTQTLFMHIGS